MLKHARIGLPDVNKTCFLCDVPVRKLEKASAADVLENSEILGVCSSGDFCREAQGQQSLQCLGTVGL